MYRASLSIAAAGLLAISGMAFAQNSDTVAGQPVPQGSASPAAAGADASATPAADPRDLEVVCRRDRATGSRTRTNVICMTRAEWVEARARTRDSLDRFRGSGGAGAGCSNGGQGC